MGPYANRVLYLARRTGRCFASEPLPGAMTTRIARVDDAIAVCGRYGYAWTRVTRLSRLGSQVRARSRP